MEIESTIRLVGNVYNVEIDLATDGFTPTEQEVVEQFGEPLVDIGGSFTDGGSLSYTLTSEDRRFPSQFPIKVQFSRVDYPDDAAERAGVYRSTLITRITAAITTLRGYTVSNLGHDISNNDTTP